MLIRYKNYAVLQVSFLGPLPKRPNTVRLVLKRTTSTEKTEYRRGPKTTDRYGQLTASEDKDCGDGERDRDRTCDRLIKSQMLYQLSYAPAKDAGKLCRAPRRVKQKRPRLRQRFSSRAFLRRNRRRQRSGRSRTDCTACSSSARTPRDSASQISCRKTLSKHAEHPRPHRHPVNGPVCFAWLSFDGSPSNRCITRSATRAETNSFISPPNRPISFTKREEMN